MTLRTFTDLAEVERPWQPLARESDNVFSTWEWASLWWRHFGAGRSLAVRSVDDSTGRSIVLLPMYRERRLGLRLTRFIGHGVADQLGPVCAPSELGLAQHALRRESGDLILADCLAGERDWSGLGGRVLHTESSPAIVIPAGAGWADYLGAHSANFRQQVRRRARRLSKAGVRFRLAQDPARLSADIDALIALHAARWGRQGRAFSGARARFHHEFAAVALERRWLRLWLAEAGDQPIAAWYGFRFGGVEYFYQAGRDPGWDRERVGAGLLEHSIREAFADGMREYRLLRGDEPYKRRYATEMRHLLTIVRPPTVRGRTASAAARVLATTPPGRRTLKAATGSG